MSNPVIDFIVTRYFETWADGKCFFDMLASQRNVDFSSFRVILVQDGTDEDIPSLSPMLNKYPFTILVVTVEHGRPAHARNAGLQASTADWVMFCDFDDSFSSVVSLCSLMNVLPTDRADLIWMKTYWEKYERTHDGGRKVDIHIIKEDFYHTHGKLYRRSMLVDNNITYNPKLLYEYQSAFNHLILSSVSSDRVQTLKTDFVPYMKTLRPDSYFNKNFALPFIAKDMFFRDVYLTQEYQRRVFTRDYICMVAETIIDVYLLCNCTPAIDDRDSIFSCAQNFYGIHAKAFEQIRKSELEIVHNNCVEKMFSFIQHAYNAFGVEITPPDTSLSAVKSWISFTPEPAPVPAQAKAPAPHSSDRIVVYCGTDNTYQNMLTSAKSLLDHTPVDAIYFLIEDDTFPFDLPPVIHTMNIKPYAEKVFPASGPNFNNAWSYMCMVRALFPPLFKAYDRILSLDIDVIVNEDISSLWDIDLSGYYYAGVPEPARQTHPTDPVYCNFGVILMNIPMMNADRIGDKVISLLNSSKLGCPEQDAFNRICAGKILALSPDYNYTPFSHITAEANREIITHYAGIKYWKHFDSFQRYTNIPFTDLQYVKEDEHE